MPLCHLLLSWAMMYKNIKFFHIAFSVFVSFIKTRGLVLERVWEFTVVDNQLLLGKPVKAVMQATVVKQRKKESN